MVVYVCVPTSESNDRWIVLDFLLILVFFFTFNSHWGCSSCNRCQCILNLDQFAWRAVGERQDILVNMLNVGWVAHHRPPSWIKCIYMWDRGKLQLEERLHWDQLKCLICFTFLFTLCVFYVCGFFTLCGLMFYNIPRAWDRAVLTWQKQNWKQKLNRRDSQHAS